VYGTGHEVRNLDKLKYVATWQTSGGSRVWHLFEVLP
jgi:hypothetical protein